MMAKRAHVYPQVSLTASDLVDVAIAAAPARVGVAEALALARKRNAGVIATGGSYVLRDDLVRAVGLGLGALRAAQMARALPVVDAVAAEVQVRRRFASGAPLVVVRGARGALGAVGHRLVGGRLAEASAAGHVSRGLPAPVRELLVTIGRIAEEQDGRAYLVGGVVRDLWRGATLGGRDLDIVVEGDGPVLARRLGGLLGGSIVEHRRFLTASVETPTFGRIDVATARSERYESPGALPRVLPAGIAEDLRRRDFTVNALAIELSSGEFGLIDPFGGRADLARRRLRVLHPLSYVEDPTRIFRAARYAARLGLSPDSATRRAQAQALRLVPYSALSGQRIAAEIALILSESDAGTILLRLGRCGAFRLLDAGCPFRAAVGRRLAAVADALAWARGRGLAVDGVGLVALALAESRPAAASSLFTRLGFAGGPLAVLERAHAGAAALGSRLGIVRTPSVRARELRGAAPIELAWLWLTGDREVRAVVDWFVGLEPRVVSLSGDDVAALGVPRGPAVARVLAELRDGRLDGTLASRELEEAYVRQWIAKGG
jgi:tRNA nucleotidyltransferase (CCA-adding enzyme)